MSSNEFITYIEENIDLINEALELNLMLYKSNMLENANKILDYFNVFLECSEGGKRIRPVLTMLGYEMFGGKRPEKVFDVAIAFEIFQTGILMHDDIIDKSEYRRNKKSGYMKMGGDHFAISQAICLGDLGFPLANKAIIDSDFEENIKVRALKALNDTFYNTITGEIIDIDLSKFSTKNEQDIIDMYTLKTAYYTIIGPMQVGAILAGATEEQLSQIEEFGKLVGVMFQIQDDKLGIFGDEKNIGKSNTSDIKEGKNTVLSLYTFNNSNKEQKEILKKIYGKNEEISSEELNIIRKIFEETGSKKYAEDLINKNFIKSQEMLNKFKIVQKKKEIVEDMLKYLINRDK